MICLFCSIQDNSLLAACKSGDLELVQLLMKQGADPNTKHGLVSAFMNLTVIGCVLSFRHGTSTMYVYMNKTTSSNMTNNLRVFANSNCEIHVLEHTLHTAYIRT